MELTSGYPLKDRYIIKHQLGKGGMGAVYLAEDTALDQQVAVKANLNPSQQSQHQFEMEARLLAKLRHPNLPLVFDHFIIDDVQYLVMDFIPGEDLSQILEKDGPQAFYKVLEWADQITSALSYLHSQSPPVIHRDIKPANLKIQPDGKIVLVDFGIAKSSTGDTIAGARGYSPGFAPPEQYSSATTGSYSDQYSLGATLFTLLTGSPPPESIDLVLGQKSLPSTRTFSPKIPLHVDTAIQRAMQVEPDQRYESVSQFLTALTDPAALSSEPGTQPAQADPETSRWQPQTEQRPAETNPRPAPTEVLPPAQARPAPTEALPPAQARPAPTEVLPPAQARPSSADSHQPTQSLQAPTLQSASPPAASKPNRLAFYLIGVLVVAAGLVGAFLLFGGEKTDPTPPLAAVPSQTQADLAGELTSTSQPTATQAAQLPPPTQTPSAAPTQTPTLTDTPPPKPTPLGFGGKIAFVSSRAGRGYNQIFVMDSNGGNLTQLTFDDSGKSWPIWSPDGSQILYIADGGFGLYNTPLNLDVWVMNADGSNQTNLTQTRGVDEDPAWSPDGSQIVFVSYRFGGTRQLMVMNADGSDQRRVSNEFEEYNPTFSPDGQTLLFSSTFFYTLNIRRWDQTNHPPEAQDLFDLDPELYDNRWDESDRIGKGIEPAWSPDGDWIAYVRTSGNNRRIYLLDANSEGATVRSLDTLGLNYDPAWSPDSLWIVFASTRDGNMEIYRMDFGGRFQTNLTNHPGEDKMPSWQPLP